MNAVADDTEARVRRLHGLEKSALEHKLNDWGHWLEARLDFEGYPQSDAVAAALDGAGGGTPGPRCIYLAMPDRLWSLHQRICRLPEHEHAAVVVWYVPTMRLDKPRDYVIVNLEAGISPPERWMDNVAGRARMVSIIDEPMQRPRRFEVHVRGIGKVGVTDTMEQAKLLTKSLRRQEELSFGRQWTTAEKAERLGISVNGLSTRLHRARARLLGVLPLFAGV